MWKIFDDYSLARQDTDNKICEVDEFSLRYGFYIVPNPPIFSGGSDIPILQLMRRFGTFCQEKGVST